MLPEMVLILMYFASAKATAGRIEITSSEGNRASRKATGDPQRGKCSAVAAN